MTLKLVNEKQQTATIKAQSTSLMSLYMQFAYWLFIALLCLVVMGLYMKYSNVGLDDPERFGIGPMVYGTAHKPFVYRVLVPGIVRVVTPLIQYNWVEAAIDNPVLGSWLSQLDVSTYPREVFVTLLVLYASLLGFAYVFMRLMEVLRYSRVTTVIMTVGLLLLAPQYFSYGKLYDLPTLFLFTAGLWLMAKMQWGWFLFAFILASLNKETSILLTLIFIVYYWKRLDRESYLYLAIVQLILYGLIKAVLTLVFLNNPGTIVEYHLQDHIEIISMAPFILVLSSLSVGIVAWLAAKDWGRKPAFIKSCLVMIPPLIGLYVLFGFPFEVRVFLEALPVITLLTVPPGA